MRILHAPADVDGQASVAAQGARALGHEAEVWQYGSTPAGRADRVFDVAGRPDRMIAAFRASLDRGFDVYHFHLARSLMPAVGGLPAFWDLPVIRALGKRIVFTFHGTDDAEATEEALALIRTYANGLVVSSPLTLEVVPEARYVPRAIDVAALPLVGPRGDERPTVVYVSSRGRAERTDPAVKALESLATRGIAFDLRVCGAASADATGEIDADADVVVSGLDEGDLEVSSLVAMGMGKPVVARIRPEVRAAHPALPIVDTDAGSVAEAVRSLLLDAGRRARLGRAGRAYVEAEHAPRDLASSLLPLYEAPASPVWRVFPGWAGIATDTKLEARERRIRALEASIAALKRRDEQGVVGDLRTLYGDALPARAIRRARSRRR